MNAWKKFTENKEQKVGSRANKDNGTVITHGSYDTPVPSGETLLNITAAKSEYLDLLSMFISKGANTNRVNIYGVSPLMCAVRHQNVEAVKLLIEGGAEISEETRFGMTPLISAITCGDHEIVELLLKHGVSQKYRLNTNKKLYHSPINVAIEHNNLRLLELLIRYGGDVNNPDNQGNFPLAFAAKHGNFRCFTYLLEHGAQVFLSENITDNLLPYTLRKKTHNCEFVEFIANKLIEKEQYQTLINSIKYVIHIGCSKCFNMYIDKGLFKDEVDIKDENGLTPLVYAFTNSTSRWQWEWTCNCKTDFKSCQFTTTGNVPRYSTLTCSIADRKIIDRLIELGADFRFLWTVVLTPTPSLRYCDYEALHICICVAGVTEGLDNIILDAIFKSLGNARWPDLIVKFCESGFTPTNKDVEWLKERFNKVNMEEGRLKQNKYSVGEMFYALETLVKNPRSLNNVCVIVIRRTLHRNVFYGVKQLNIPATLAKQITLETDLEPTNTEVCDESDSDM